MTAKVRLPLAEIEQRVCDVASKQFGILRHRISPSCSLVEDLGIDSLDLVEFIMDVEKEFCVTLPENPRNPVEKTVFTRQPFRLCDLAELVYFQQGTGSPERKGWLFQARPKPVPAHSMPFTHLDGRWKGEPSGRQKLLEPLKAETSVQQYRRRSDGLRCILIPSACVEIGCDAPDALRDEMPKHVAELDAFLIDAEPISTTAYCRFLNSVAEVCSEALEDWFVLDPGDDRNEHMLITHEGSEWRPVPGIEKWPMILVSWFGANAYSLWANGKNWKDYRDDRGTESESFLPSEAQWEYAARGSRYQRFPWGDAPPSQDRMRYEQHRRSATYRANTLPMADVNEQLGMSPFGLSHMAGNIWQWCRDWYDAAFYQRKDSREANPVNREPTQVRSERGGSWIGPAQLCRSSYRRGRPPAVRGRCLGFRCISSIKDAP
jgi:acyl carrier protein